MKKALLLIFLCFSVFFAVAQSQHGGISYGFNAGMSLFNVTNNDRGKSIAGFSGGIYASFPLSRHLYIQPELNYQVQGLKYYIQLYGGGSDADVSYLFGSRKMNYINLPVLVKYNLLATNFSFYIGPQLGYLTDSKSSFNSFFQSDIEMKKLDFAGVYGLEYFFPINKKTAITLNARYATSFTKNYNLLYSDLSNEYGKHKGFIFTVGLRF